MEEVATGTMADSGAKGASYYPLVLSIQEIVPNIKQSTIVSLLQQNGFDMERTLDAALALAVALEDGNDDFSSDEHNNELTSKQQLSVVPTTSHGVNVRVEQNIRTQSQGNIVGEAKIVRPTSSSSFRNQGHDSGSSIQAAIGGTKGDYSSSSSTKISVAAPLSRGQHRDSLTSSRGTAMVLPPNFLIAPRFRFTCRCVSLHKIEFSVRYCRRDSKLGFTIQERNGFIEIVALQNTVKTSQELLLAKQSGVAVGDLLIGINDERFGPWAELQDVMDVLNLSGTYVTMHYLRRLELEVDDLSLYPRRMKLLVENDVIKTDQVPIIDQIIEYLRERVIKWSSDVLARKVELWHLDSIEIEEASVTNHNQQRRQSMALPKEVRKATISDSNAVPIAYASVSSSGGINSRSSQSVASVRLDRRHTLDPRVLSSYDLLQASVNEPNDIVNSSKSSAKYSQLETQNLRPALSVRVLRAETSKYQDHIVYVIWVLDVKSGVEWVVRRRFREFFDFRDTVVSIRKKLQSLEFPVKTMAIVTENHPIVAERLAILQRFLRRLAGLITINSHHPSTIKLHMALQRFLMVEDRLDRIVLKESDPATHLTKTVEVFIHSFLHLAIMDRVLQGFIDSFLSHQADDIGKHWTESEAEQVLKELRNFFDHLQNFLCEALIDDCSDIVGAVLKNGVQLPAQASRLIERLTAGVQDDSSPTEAHNSEIRKAEMCDVLVQITTDEFRTVIRSAIRRQVETEIYLACCGRLKFVLNQVMGTVDEKFANRLYHLSAQPQSYYEIPLQHISPSSWEESVTAFRRISNQTLPCDMIDSLLTASKSIFTVYKKEHPEASAALGADEILPIFIYILTQAQVKNLIQLNYELQMLCDEDKRMSEAGYYLATLQASITHILEADLLKEKPFLPPSRHDDDDNDSN